MTRANWLCGCGQGGLAVPVDEIPTECPLCGQPIPGHDQDDDDDTDHPLHPDRQSSCPGWTAFDHNRWHNR